MGTDERALLDAGAVLATAGPGGAHAPDDTDVLTARAYRHAAIEDRVVVRLVPETLGSAEDLALEYLGFAGDREAAVPVGRVLRQSLGFPAWALVNDPDNGHHALAVVKEMERLTRLIATKPGHAKDGFEEIGQRLDRSVPQFLPTYYEQVARLFLGAESRQYATAFFGKARAAEQRHTLVVDEERLREVFVEFAAAGALSAKTLRDHAKSLAERLTPGEAFAQFKAVCLQRCAAGLAPYAGLLEDLRRLAKAAGREADAEERVLLTEVLATGAVERAAVSFWKAARGALTGLAREDAGVRARLLALLPAAGGEHRAEFDASWLSMLDSCGAIDLLLDGTVPAADWLSGWARHRQRGWGRTGRVAAEAPLVVRLAGRLRGDGRAVRLFTGRSWRPTCDLDLLDACLAAGVPVADPPAQATLPLSDWVGDRAGGRAELAAVVADERFAPLMRHAVETLAGEGDGPARLLDLVASPVLGPVVGGWLAERARDLSQPFGLPELERQLGRLARFDAPAVLASAPRAVARIAATDPAPALARTLRGGVFDELGWSALDDAVTRLGGPGRPPGGMNSWHGPQHWYRVHDAWPAMIVRLDTRVALVGPDAVLEERTLTLPAPQTRSWDEPTVRYVDGQWLVLSGQGDERRGVWSGRPADLFRPSGDLDDRWQRLDTVSLSLPGGGRSFGGRPIHLGDTSFAERRQLAGDGISHWVELDGEWREFDAATGRHGRLGVPAFFDAALAGGDGARLVQSACRLAPVPPGLESSPWGCKDGLLGWWVREDKHGSVTACSVDGARGTVLGAVVTGPVRHPRAADNEMPLPPLRLPGGAVLHPRVCSPEVRFYSPEGVQLGTVQPGGPGNGFAGGTALVPPLWYWHALRPRDERGSAALRTVTDADAAALLAALAGGRSPQDAVTAVLPAITHPALVEGVAGLVATAATHAAGVARFAEKARRPVAAAAVVARHARDGALNEALGGLPDGSRGYAYRNNGDQSSTAMAQVRAVLRMIGGDAPEHGGRIALAATSVGWLSLIGTGMATVVWRAASPATDAAHREALLEFLDTALDGADTPLADPRGRLRVVELCESASAVEDRVGQVLRAGDRVLLVLACLRAHDDRRHWSAVEFHPSGVFGAWEGFDLKSSRILGAPGDPVRGPGARRMAALVRERGALPCRPERAEAFAGLTGVDVSAAAMLLLGLPGIDGYGQHGLPGKEVLDGYGLKPGGAELARVLLAPLSLADRRCLIADLVPSDPRDTARLWDEGADLTAVTRGWLTRFGRRPTVPTELLARARREGVRPDLVVRVLSPDHQREWTGRTRQRLENGRLVAADPGALLTGTDLASCTHALRWLAYRLPYGDPLRAVLPRTLRALRERLADPDLLLDLGADWTAQGQATSTAIRAAYGLAETGGEGADALVAAGPALVLSTARYGQGEAVWLRAAAVVTGQDAGAGHPALALLAGMAPMSAAVRALRDVLSEEFEALLSAGEGVGAPQDPTGSVPELVGEAAARLGCSADAAALYLMLLALPDPTDRNTAAWTGWKPARLKGARAELAAGGLVVEAKRARAGRTLFLPGGWREQTAPRLPVEVWKESLFDGWWQGVTVPGCPVPELFRRAWRRVTDGDAPGFEEFVSRRGKRGGQGGAR